MTYPRFLLVAATVPLLVAGLAACSGASDGASPSKSPKTVSEHDWRLAQAKCMRAAGHNVQDPSADGRGQGISLGDGDSLEKFSADNDTCNTEVTAKFGERPVSDEEKKAKQKGLEDEDCLRKEGIDVEGDKALDLGSIPADVQKKCGIDGGGTSHRTTP